MKRIILSVGLVFVLIGVTVIAVSSIRAPDPLHSTSAFFNGVINNDSRTILLLKDVQKGKNISLSVKPQSSFDFLNVRIINPKGTILLNLNSSQPVFTTITPTISGNYSAVLSNLKNVDTYTDSMFASAILFESNGQPKIENYTILIGVIILLIGIATSIIWITLKFFDILKKRTRYKQLS